MKRVFSIVAVCLVVILSLSVQIGAAEKEWDIKDQTIEKTAPDFTLTDLDGKEHSLSEYRGQVVLLQFSTTWCPHCRSIIPRMRDIHDTYGEKGLKILFVAIQESARKMKAFAEETGVSYPVVLDTKGDVARLYKVVGVPTLVLVDKDGTILCRQCRMLDILLESLLG